VYLEQYYTGCFFDRETACRKVDDITAAQRMMTLPSTLPWDLVKNTL
jgi:hypothetical protein